MIEVRAIRPGDIEALAGCAVEVMARPHMSRADELLAGDRHAWTAVDFANQRPLAAGGFHDCGWGNALAWGVFSPIPPQLGLPLFRAFRARLAAAPFRWIEAQIPVDIPAAERFDRLLGFVSIDSRMVLANGREFHRYVHVKDFPYGN